MHYSIQSYSDYYMQYTILTSLFSVVTGSTDGIGKAYAEQVSVLINLSLNTLLIKLTY